MKRPGRIRGYIENEADVVYRYTVLLEPMIKIAKDYSVTRQAVWFCLQRNGVHTDKARAGNIVVSCHACGKKIVRHRADVRDRVKLFCDSKCFYLWLNRKDMIGHKFIENNQGKREARKIASQYIELQPGYIVHHEDRDQGNNAIKNLKVFSNAGDHTRYHRGYRVPILWDGALQEIHDQFKENLGV